MTRENLKCQGLQPIACQDRRGFVIGHVAGGFAASEIVVVHGGKIVVYQGVGMNQFDRAGRTVQKVQIDTQGLTMLYYLVGTLYVLTCLLLIVVVLLQQGKGGDIANAFGGGGSQAAFGARSGATVLSRATTVLAVLFVVGALAGLAIHTFSVVIG